MVWRSSPWLRCLGWAARSALVLHGGAVWTFTEARRFGFACVPRPFAGAWAPFLIPAEVAFASGVRVRSRTIPCGAPARHRPNPPQRRAASSGPFPALGRLTGIEGGTAWQRVVLAPPAVDGGDAPRWLGLSACCDARTVTSTYLRPDGFTPTTDLIARADEQVCLAPRPGGGQLVRR